MAAARFGEFGATRGEAEKTSFFNWFHLIESGRDGPWTRFRPSSEQLGPLVAIDFDFDEGGRTRAVRLLIERRFVDSPRDFASAADITKSFLLAAMGPSASQASQEIFAYRPQGATAVILSRGPGPAAPEIGRESAEYLVYGGLRESSERDGGGLRLTCGHGETTFIAEVRLGAPVKRGWFSRLFA